VLVIFQVGVPKKVMFDYSKGTAVVWWKKRSVGVKGEEVTYGF
jgi:hypothetical protein